MSRYKGYLKNATPSPESSEAAASLYTILLDILNSPEDFYDTNTRFGETHRLSLAPRKFDQSYLDIAASKQQFVPMAKRLAIVMNDKLPLEEERVLFWDNLDWIFAYLSRATPDQFAAVEACKKIVPLIREGKNRTLKYGFYTAVLEFRANNVGKEPAATVADYEKVIAAQKAYFDAYPNADVLSDIINVDFGGYGIADATPWQRNAKQNIDFFTYAFPKLATDKDRTAMINYRGWWNLLATTEQWSNWGIQFPAAFKASPQLPAMSFAYKGNDPNLFKQQATFLAGVQSINAGVINAMAAGGMDLNAAIAALVTNDSWYCAPTELYSAITGQMWPWFSSYPRDAANALPPDYWTKAYMKFMNETFVKSPLAMLDATGSAGYVSNAWAGAPAAEKTQVIAFLHNLDWVPYTDAERKSVFQPTYDQFKQWTEQLRTTVTAAQKAVTDGTAARDAAKTAVDAATKARDAADAASKPAKEQDLTAKTADLTAKEAALKTATEALKPQQAIVAQINPIEEAFKQMLDPTKVDITKAPTPLTQKLAAAAIALRDKKQDDFKKLCREIYPMVANFDQKKIPFGGMVFNYITAQRVDFEMLDVETEILAAEGSAWAKGQPAMAFERAFSNLWNGRPGWGMHGSLAAEAPKIKILNNALAKALRDQMAKNSFLPEAFEWFRGTRHGNGWTEPDLNSDVMATVVEKKFLVEIPEYRVGHANAATSYMYLIRNEFPTLAAKYPPESYFDQMFIDETTKRNWFENIVWSYSQDKTGAIAALHAKMIGDIATLPFGWTENSIRQYDPGQFWELNNRLSNFPKPVRDPAVAKIEATYGKTRYDSYAMGRTYFQTDANCTTPEARKQFFDKLTEYLTRSKSLAMRAGPPYLNAVAQIDPKTFTDAELDVLLSIFPDAVTPTWPGGWGFEQLTSQLHQGLIARHRESDLYAVVPFFWKIAKDTNNIPYQRAISQYARELMIAKQNELAAAYADAGIAVFGTDLVDDVRSNLTSVRAKAMTETGGMIPVEPSDPRYGIFVSQANWNAGKFQAAWDAYLDRRDVVLTSFKDLDTNYVIWLIGRNTETRSYDVAENLARQVMQWVDAAPESFEPEMRAGLLLAYADIAFARQEFPRARAQYERIAAANEFETTRAKRDAELRIAEVDRVTKQFDRATERLEKLLRRNDKYLQTEAYYEMALVKFDQALYPESNEALQQVFSRVPDHASARILEGKLHLMMKKLQEATEVPVGLSSSQRFVVPGKPLKVDLEDRNLAIVGSSTNVEIRVWTSSGDEEFFNLFPFGDSKTKFQGQINTELGAAKKGDHILQLLGNDTVSYDYSDKFSARTSKAGGEASQPNTLTVATDSQLFVSSGKILTKEELEERALERLIRQRLRLDQSLDKRLALDTVRAEDQIKPGNKINVRVIDGDQSIQPGAKNKIAVTVATTSGDVIDKFPLEETTPNSGVFEGAIPTSSGQATAYASDSQEGHEPNFTISSQDYPAWVGLPDNNRPKALTVDLNDSVALGQMNVLANVPGRKLKDFFVQTSVNGRDFVTCGRWPTAFDPWDGSLRVEIAKWYPRGNQPVTVDEYRRYLGETYLTRGVPKVTVKLPNLTQKWDANVLGKATELTMGVVSDWYVGDVYGAFYVPKNQVKTFKLDPLGQVSNVRYLVAIDGKPGEDPNQPGVVSRSLSKGVHRLDIFMFCYRHSGTYFDVQTDTPNPPYMISCPPEMFDPAKEPEIAKAVHVNAASVKANADNSSFDIQFAPDTKARAVRLFIGDFETDAPAINKIKLTNATSQPVLPTQQDFQQLKKNDTLEIVPGDRISVTYKDPRAITKDHEIQEAFMTATFSNAEISAAFVEYDVDQKGNRVPIYIPMRRFKPGDAVKVFVKDADADISDKLDTVKFKVKGSDGKVVEMEALETEEHSGVFMGTIAPVTTAPTKPTEVMVKEGEDVILSYFDKENTDPGIPWERTYAVEQAVTAKPQLRSFDVSSRPLTPEEAKTVAVTDERGRHFEENVAITRSIIAARPQAPQDDKTPGTCFVDGPLIVELLYPTVAQAPNSEAIIYLQTAAGRKKYGKPIADGEYDVNVPGTIRLRTHPGDIGTPKTPQGYRDVVVRGNPYAAPALDEGRFTYWIDMEMAEVPEKTRAFEEFRPYWEEPPKLAISGNDEIFIGFQYTEGDSKTPKWVTQKVKLTSDAFFDVMDRRYQETVEGIHVGEDLYFRVINKKLDTTDEKDTVAIEVKTANGKIKSIPLTETFGHSGVFKGVVSLQYVDEKAPSDEPNVLRVGYGDTITATYKPEGTSEISHSILVYKGADGQVLPFTKRFKDPAIAVQTQFTVAEAYFELSKRHRELGQEDLARREIGQGKKLLEEAIRDYPDTESRAQADFLLANLSFEFAKDSKDPEAKKKYFVESITKFSDIVSSYQDSPYAPKAQYKKALALEQMGQIDQACEEYVKLSYRYPENELVAETIARLGQYFLTKGKELEDKAAAQTDEVEKEKVKVQCREMFKTAAQVFGRLSVRFPEHKLAGKTNLLSAQCYMRAEDLDRAIKAFKAIYEDTKTDKDLAAEALYWCGDSYMKKNDFTNAYRTFKKLTWDYPEGKWAKFARGRLTDENLAKIGETDTGG